MRDRTTLYRFFDRSWRLLYVGQTQDIVRRCAEHQETKTWWAEVVTCSTLEFDTRYEAMEAEQHLIRTEAPLYNVLHNPALTDLPADLLKLERDEIDEAARLRALDPQARPGFSPSPGAEWASWRYVVVIEDKQFDLWRALARREADRERTSARRAGDARVRRLVELAEEHRVEVAEARLHAGRLAIGAVIREASRVA
jgi:hypothetical protein